MMPSLTSLDHTIRGVMSFTWPMIVVSVLTVASLRIVYLVKNKKPFVFYRELLALFFLIYILCLFQVVTVQDVSQYGEGSNFIPFQEIFRYRFGSRLFLKQVIGNVLMFVPYGFFAAYYIRSDRPWIPLFLISFASLSIEVTQLMIGRIFDIDDIILNIVGGMFGYFVYRLSMHIRNLLPRKEWILNMVSLVIVIVFIFYLYRLVI